MTETEGAAAPRPSTGNLQVLYLLHGLAPFTMWLLAIVAMIVGAASRDSGRATYLDSHYSWLQRTFWWGLLWVAISWVITGILFITIVGILLIWIPWTILFVWYLYRVIRGWLLLNEGKPAPG
jgi:uncharacterized membrane protein